MKKIIKIGKLHRWFKTNCFTCDCQFVFEGTDIYGLKTDCAYVYCPDCEAAVFLCEDLNKYSITEEEFERY